MAYSNWGAFVYRDNVRQKDKEDIGVFDCDESCYPTGFRIFVNILKTKEGDVEDEWYNHSHHAVLGNNGVRLCGYKHYPELWVVRNGKIIQEKLPEIDYEKDEWELKNQTGEVEINGKIWKWWFNQYNENMIQLMLIEPNGIKWEATCGYCYGAGHSD